VWCREFDPAACQFVLLLFVSISFLDPTCRIGSAVEPPSCRSDWCRFDLAMVDSFSESVITDAAASAKQLPGCRMSQIGLQSAAN
jgi:hypothetical protein